jgi:hypothetical protein
VLRATVKGEREKQHPEGLPCVSSLCVGHDEGEVKAVIHMYNSQPPPVPQDTRTRDEADAIAKLTVSQHKGVGKFEYVLSVMHARAGHRVAMKLRQRERRDGQANWPWNHLHPIPRKVMCLEE